MSTDSAQWWQASATRLAEAYRAGEVSPVNVLASCLSRIDAVNPVLNAIIFQRRDAVRREAEASAARFARGQALGPLDGLPIVIKDNLLTCDLPTTWGSRVLKDYRSEHDELVVECLRAGGALIVGKTNVPEYTLEGYTCNSLFGVTRNPWNRALTPGGSSGGSVAAVAAGMVPLALGADGGGSTRRPASHTGVVGLKPSIGAIARTHTLPQLLLDLELVGVIARSVADVRLLFDAVRGPIPRIADRWLRPAPPLRSPPVQETSASFTFRPFATRRLILKSRHRVMPPPSVSVTSGTASKLASCPSIVTGKPPAYFPSRTR